MEKTTKTLFDTLYEGCEDAIKSMKKPLAVRSIKRKIRGGYDAAESAIDTCNASIEKEVSNILDMDLNAILTEKATIRNNREHQDDLATLYKELFDADFVPSDD